MVISPIQELLSSWVSVGFVGQSSMSWVESGLDRVGGFDVNHELKHPTQIHPYIIQVEIVDPNPQSKS